MPKPKWSKKVKNKNSWRLLSTYQLTEQALSAMAQGFASQIHRCYFLFQRVQNPALRYFLLDEERSWDEKIQVLLSDDLEEASRNRTTMWEVVRDRKDVLPSDKLAVLVRLPLIKAAETVRALEMLAINFGEWAKGDPICKLRIEDIARTFEYLLPPEYWLDEGLEARLSETFERCDDPSQEDGKEDDEDDDDDEIDIILDIGPLESSSSFGSNPKPVAETVKVKMEKPAENRVSKKIVPAVPLLRDPLNLDLRKSCFWEDKARRCMCAPRAEVGRTMHKSKEGMTRSVSGMAKVFPSRKEFEAPKESPKKKKR